MPQIPDPTTEIHVCLDCGLAFSARLGRYVPSLNGGARIWYCHFCADKRRDQRNPR